MGGARERQAAKSRGIVKDGRRRPPLFTFSVALLERAQYIDGRMWPVWPTIPADRANRRSGGGMMTIDDLEAFGKIMADSQRGFRRPGQGSERYKNAVLLPCSRRPIDSRDRDGGSSPGTDEDLPRLPNTGRDTGSPGRNARGPRRTGFRSPNRRDQRHGTLSDASVWRPNRRYCGGGHGWLGRGLWLDRQRETVEAQGIRKDLQVLQGTDRGTQYPWYSRYRRMGRNYGFPTPGGQERLNSGRRTDENDMGG